MDCGYTSVSPLLDDESAARLFDRVNTWPRWNLVTCIEGEHRDFDAEGMERLEPGRRVPFNQLVFREAQAGGFQYLYENFALYESGRNGRLDDPVLAGAFAFVRSEAFLTAAREITGYEDVTFTDCQLTRYRAGHFLTMHDDLVDGKSRRAAYILNLTPDWRVDYGGILQIIDEKGDVVCGLTPAFNRLCLLKVPSRHAVSCIAPFAPGARYAITGWLRAGAEPELSAS